MRSKRVLSAVAVAAIAGLVVTACGSGDGGSGGNDGTLRLGLGEPKSLIPPNVGETEGGEITQLVYSGLYTYDVDGSLKPVIADGAPTTEDNKVWTIKVKPGFTFQNGEAINAETFVKTWNYATYGPNGNKGSYFFDKVAGYADVQSGADPDGEEGPKKGADPKAKELSGVKALDENTLEITLDKPWIGFSTMLGYTAFYPMADACLAAVDACNETPIGNGMYQFDGKWEHSTAIKLKKWVDYKGEQPTIEKFNFKIYTGDATAYPDFRAGTIDIAAPTADKYAEAKSQYPDMIEVASNSHWSVGFPVYDDVFKDPKVRKAFSMAIDRQAFVDGVFQGRYTPANSWTPSIITGFLDN
ncbi:MAG TPA: ABC transporter substrate-binding protein, partial [Phytomonospora sp.]